MINTLLNRYFANAVGQDGLREKIKKLGPFADNYFSRDNHPFHFTSSAWVVDKDFCHTLLIFHNKLQMWIQPGGHADGEFDLCKVAYDEAFEETGLSSLEILNGEIFDFDITPIPAFKDVAAHAHLDTRFVIIADMSEIITESNETSGARWFPLIDINSITNDVGIVRMASKTLAGNKQ